MKTLAHSAVQSRFEAVLDQARCEPVVVTQDGRPVVVMMGYEEGAEALRLLAGRRMSSFLDGLPVDPAAEALTEEAVNRLVHELRP